MLSAICPTFNRADFLHECVAPLMELPIGTAEVLVVDDCSTDNTEQVCAELTRRYGSDRLRYFRLERNQGAPGARNRGIEEARGDYLMFVDSDDVAVASGIRDLVRKLDGREELDYVYGKVVPTDGKLCPLVGQDTIGFAYNGSSAELAGYHWHTMGAVYRRACVQKVGPWNRELTGSQDWEYQARVKLFGGSGSFLPVLVGYWRQHGECRVGTTSFRPDYVTSVTKACGSILAHAKEVGKCDQALERKISKRLLVHAIAFGAAGYRQEKNACLAQAAETARDDSQLQGVIKVLKWAPQPIDLLADLAARWIQGRP
jgi:glycosyltransferase involved in cell wall biosynthesis